jgi:hypothetical protein
VRVTGRVSDADEPSRGVGGAVVSAELSVPRAFRATTNAAGLYTLTVPDPYGCFVQGLDVSAEGYVAQSLEVTGAELQADPMRDFALEPSPANATPTPTVSPRPTATPSAPPSPTATFTVAPSPTATPCEVTVIGQVYEADVSPIQPIGGARIVARLNFPRSFDAVTDASGHYSLLLPEMYGCYVQSLDVMAEGYVGQSLPVTITELRDQPTRNFALVRGGAAILISDRRTALERCRAGCAGRFSRR